MVPFLWACKEKEPGCRAERLPDKRLCRPRCRELCERYGASIDYRARAAGDLHCNEFFVVMRRMPLTDTEARLQLTS